MASPSSPEATAAITEKNSLDESKIYDDFNAGSGNIASRSAELMEELTRRGLLTASASSCNGEEEVDTRLRDYLIERLLTAEERLTNVTAAATNDGVMEVANVSDSGATSTVESRGAEKQESKSGNASTNSNINPAAFALLQKKLQSAERMLSKAEMSKSKLEQLCRELQKAFREEKEQSSRKLKLMQRTHQEAVEGFKKSLTDIQQTYDAGQEHGKKVAEVEKLSADLNQLALDYDKKLTDLKQLYTEREFDILRVARAKEKEIGQLQTDLLGMQERVKEVFEENVKLKKELLVSEERTRQAIESELELKKVLDSYSTKYNKLVGSLEQSDSAFERIKAEMGKMNGNLIRVEADARSWKKKVEEANKVILTMTTERVNREEALALKDRQLVRLQELCRRLQKGGGGGDRGEDSEGPSSSSTTTANEKEIVRAETLLDNRKKQSSESSTGDSAEIVQISDVEGRGECTTSIIDLGSSDSPKGMSSSRN